MSEDPYWRDDVVDDVVPLHPSMWAYDEETETWIDLEDTEDVLWW